MTATQTNSAAPSAKRFARSSNRSKRGVGRRTGRPGPLPFAGHGKPAAATGATEKRLVDRLVEAGPQRDWPADDRRGVDPLLAEHDSSREAHDEPNRYCTEDVWLHRFPPRLIDLWDKA